MIDGGWRSKVGASEVVLMMSEVVWDFFVNFFFFLFEMLTILGFGGLKAHVNHVAVSFLWK